MTHLPAVVLRTGIAIALLASITLSTLHAQVGPGTGGLARLDQLQRAQGQWRRVLVVGAHPDDEDTELITILSRGQGITTGYLALTRGEGGQNLIGNELGAALGVLRTEELLAARRIDGGHQYFTRAFDFGFSKSAEETFRFWPRDSLLKDVVRIIRRFRPQVIVSVFNGTTADGHGHHQAAGIIARAAFDVAGDPAVFPELLAQEGLAAWQPAKFYRDYRASGPTIQLDGSALDPASGQTLHQVAMRSRSQHRSQDMGQLESLGASGARIALEALAPGIEASPLDSLFAGVMAEAPGPHATETEAELRLAEASVIVDAFVDDHEVTPGQVVPLTVTIFNAGVRRVLPEMFTLNAPGFELLPSGVCPPIDSLARGAMFECTLSLRVNESTSVSQPYFLLAAPHAGMYVWSGPTSSWGLPFDTPITISVKLHLGAGEPIMVTREIAARSLDQAVGEVRRPVTVVPRVMLDISPGRVLWPRQQRTRTFAIMAESGSPDTLAVAVGLMTPPGWRSDSATRFTFDRSGERGTAQLEVSLPSGAPDGELSLAAFAADDGDTTHVSARRIEYPHIRPRTIFYQASAQAVVAPVRFAINRRIGYVRGAADAIPEAMVAAGQPIRLLDAAGLASRALDSLDVLVIGPRAYEINDDLQRAHPRVLEFARRGGTLIIQYQQYQFLQGGFAPLALEIARPHDRVTDENAAVTLLDPEHAAFRSPNQIAEADFAGWIQERGLYFASKWDSAWQPLLSSHDEGESAKSGGLLIANFGRGTVIYTGLAFFRQLPAAVPGAWKLFANLLAL
jgi:LmbE family N-acetylglucosaminyl deacetylase